MTGIDVLAERMLLKDADSGELFRIVAIENGNLLWICSLQDTSWPCVHPYSAVVAGVQEGYWEIEYVDPFADSRRGQCGEEGSPSDENYKARVRILTYVIERNLHRLFLYPANRRKLFVKTAKDLKISYQYLKIILKLYWARGMQASALCNNYANCGGPGKPHSTGDIKRGAPRRISVGEGINADEMIKRTLKIGADYWLDRKPKPNMKAAHDYIVQLFFSEISTDDTGNVKVVVNIQQPTINQLRYYIDVNYTRQEVAKRRYGRRQFDLHMRGITGSATEHVIGPGDSFAIDATIADIYLRSQFDRRRIVGRPVVYFVVDIWSRLITGFYCGFEGPSWLGAVMALINVVTPKVTFCQSYDVEIDESLWPSRFAPRCILADKGELLSTENGRRITELGIKVENTPAWRPDLKAIVERRFGIVPAIFRPFAPGYVEKDFNQRGAKDYRLDAALNLHEFTAIIIRAIIEHNDTPIASMDLVPGLITDEGTPSPLELWKWGIQNRSGRLQSISIDAMALAVLPRGKARVTAGGIRFDGAYYSSDEAIRNDWFSDARRSEWNITIVYDPRDYAIAYRPSDRLPGGYEKLKLLPKSEGLESRSSFERGEMARDNKRQISAAEPERQARRIKFDLESNKIVEAANEALDLTGVRETPNSQQTKDIRNNRKEEKQFQREFEKYSDDDAFASSEDPCDEVDDSPSLDPESEALDRMRKNRAGRNSNQRGCNDDQ